MTASLIQNPNSLLPQMEPTPTHEFSEIDIKCMLVAIAEGEKGRFTAPPNPWVGCVIADDFGNIKGKGYHVRAGEDHAEVAALKDAMPLGHKLVKTESDPHGFNNCCKNLTAYFFFGFFHFASFNTRF